MAYNLFDILGPVTIGPSSSHTAGAVRIGLACRLLLGGDVKKAKITFYGSFAETYKGHGTDKAVVGGLLGFNTDNEKIRESLQLAEFRGMQFEIDTAEDPRFHPNTVVIRAQNAQRQVKLRACSVGGGAIRLQEINGFEVSVSCTYDTLIIFHRDMPGVLAEIAHTLSSSGYNIGNLHLSRARREGDVITVVETDVPVDPNTVAQLRTVGSVFDVVALPKF
ncbi:MAG: L-serine ammonia-lyase, iron-sulfur-dependent subunit beta [Clostridiaceae bacterium]|nr:L-serine ammonia-lyase, iron-sulfur-dependent subunit beta [Clostridiaceae bacterium]